MRIISQGGRSDLPYEEIAVCMACEDIIARHNDKEYLMARYSTMKKAKKAMEMLHRSYTGMPVVFQNVELADDVIKMFDDFRKNGDKESKVEYIENVIFQFPQDEDVEV